MTYAVLKGLRPEIRSYVLQKYAKTIAVVLSCGRIAEQVRPGAPAQTEAMQRDKQTRGSKRQVPDLHVEAETAVPAVGHCPANDRYARSADR